MWERGVATGVGVATVGLGIAGVVRPAALMQGFGVTEDTSPRTTFIVRAAGIRHAVVGAMWLAARDDATRRRLLRLGSLMAAADVGLAVSGASSGAISSASAARVASTAALFGVLCGVAGLG